MARSRLIYAFSIIAAIVFCIFYTGWLAIFLLFVIALVPVFSFLLTLPAALKLHVKISCPETIDRGENFNADIIVKAPYPIRLLRMTAVSLNHFTGVSEVFDVINVNAVQNVVVHEEVSSNQCGKISITLTKLKVYDYTGVFFVRLRAKSRVSVVVLPLLHKPQEKYALPDEILHKHLVAAPAGTYAEEHDIRPYRIGDPMSTVHWKLSQKTASLLAKEPLVPIKQKNMVSFDYRGDVYRLEMVLGEALWLFSKLLDMHKTAHFVYFASDGSVTDKEIDSMNGLYSLITEILTDVPPLEAAGDACAYCAGAGWHRHITFQEEVAS